MVILLIVVSASVLFLLCMQWFKVASCVLSEAVILIHSCSSFGAWLTEGQAGKIEALSIWPLMHVNAVKYTTRRSLSWLYFMILVQARTSLASL
jgi:hypothetical protein